MIEAQPRRTMDARVILYRTLLSALLLTLASPGLAQSITPAEMQRIDSTVTATLAKSGVPSASIAIVRGGRVVYAKAYGKQAETGTTRDDAPYQIASISKQFTAAAVLLLQRDGKLSLDNTVAKYIPDITGGDTITIRQLLSHTAGLQDYWPQDYSFKAMATPVTPQQIVDRWAKKPLDFAPGTQWQYSNTGYVVAGMIVEKVSGQTLLDFLQARIFKPLGMTAYDQDLAIGPGFPRGYGRAALGPLRAVTPAAHGWLYAAGELSMSARSLALWDVARLERSVLTTEDWAAQETPVKLADGTTNGYGLGVFSGNANGHRYIEHSGEAVGFLSENIVYPDDKAAIVVLTNSWSNEAFKVLAQKLSSIVLTPPAPDPADAAALTQVRSVFDQVREGTLDRSRLTENANFYFNTTTLGDYRTSLAPLGKPRSFVQMGKARLRGGFINRVYRVEFPKITLVISTYAEPGSNGKIEQFLVAPTQQ